MTIQQAARSGIAKTLPDFLVIGAAKAGTSALYQYMREHPQIFMPAKEIRYFAYDGGEEARDREERFGKHHFEVKSLEAYEALFTPADPSLSWGEIAPIYLESPSAPRRIRELIPDVRLIASLRNPVHRAFSGYVMQVRSGREHRPVHEAFDPAAHHVQAGFYHAQIKRYLDLFPREQLMLILYEEFARDNKRTLRDTFEFLGVDPDFEPPLHQKHNVSTYPKSRLFNTLIENRLTRDVLRPAMPGWLRHFARRAKKSNLGKPPRIPPVIHAHLLDIYREDILRLQDLTRLDLSSWLKPPA